MKRTIALVFAFIALAWEIALSIMTPTAESITACVFSAIIIIALLSMKTVTLVEDAPNGKRPVDKALKLANEIAPYIKEKDGKITITVIK